MSCANPNVVPERGTGMLGFAPLTPTYSSCRCRRLGGEEVAERWLRLYPIRDEERYEARKATLMASIETYRKRLCDLSWFMKSLDEYIARKANAEDKVTGRFWEG